MDGTPAASIAGIESLPVETLGRCFLFLPLNILDRIPILHVSRFWRSTAFDCTGVWSRLYISDGNRNGHLLVDLVLSHTRHHPVDLHYGGFSGRQAPSDVWAVVEKHMHRMRSIDWTAGVLADVLTHPAPRLERISGSLLYRIPRALLGGVPGRLRTLHASTLILPEACPALATVTDLKFATGTEPEDSPFLHLLFELFPQLESLELDVHVRETALLPPGPAPPTLKRLRLNSIDKYYDFSEDFNRLDLIDLCKSWQVLPRLESLGLSSFILDDMDFAYILDGAVGLLIAPDEHADERTRIVAYHPDDKEYTLNLLFRTPDEEEKVVQFLLAAAHCLSRVHTLTMASGLFELLFADEDEPLDLPLLAKLSVIVDAHAEYEDAVQHLPRSLPQLETLEVHTRAEQRGYVPQAETQALVAALSTYLDVLELEGRNVVVKIAGLPDPNQAAVGVDVPPGKGYSIIFVSSRVVCSWGAINVLHVSVVY